MDEEGEGGHKLRRTVRRHDRPLHRPPKAVQVMGQGTRGRRREREGRSSENCEGNHACVVIMLVGY